MSDLRNLKVNDSILVEWHLPDGGSLWKVGKVIAVRGRFLYANDARLTARNRLRGMFEPDWCFWRRSGLVPNRPQNEAHPFTAELWERAQREGRA